MHIHAVSHCLFPHPGKRGRVLPRAHHDPSVAGCPVSIGHADASYLKYLLFRILIRFPSSSLVRSPEAAVRRHHVSDRFGGCFVRKGNARPAALRRWVGYF